MNILERFFCISSLLNLLRMNNKKNCLHYTGSMEDVSPNASRCEECQKEELDWVALRMCLTCGHVGCCDSSIGSHATRHFNETRHPVMVALPNRSWKWCYIDKEYVH